MANTKKYVSLDKLGLYNEKINKVISDGDAATLEAAAAAAEALGVNYDAAGAAATAKSEAIAHADAEVAKANAAAAAAQAQADKGVADAATADGKAVAAQTAVDELAEYVGTIPEGATATDVVGYVIEKTSGIATEGAMTELTNRVGTVEGKVATIEGDYLKKADKEELAGDIADVQTALEGEAATARAAEEANAAAIKTISDDYLKAADKTELQNNINTVSGAVELLTNGVKADEVDGVNDLIQYVKDHGTEVTGMQGDIAQNASDIAGVAGRMTTAEGKITAVEGAVATKVEQTAYDAKIAALEGADSGLDTRLQAVEAKFGDGEGNVEAQIEAAKAAAIEAAASDAASKDAALKTEIETAYKKYADDEDARIESRVDALETASATHALASDLTALAGRVTTAEGEIDTLQSEMDAVEAKALANEGAISTINTELAKKAADADLTAAKDRITALETWHSNFIEVSEEEINGLFA